MVGRAIASRDDGAIAYITLGDLDAVTSQRGIERPPAGARTGDLVTDWMEAILGRRIGSDGLVAAAIPQITEPWVLLRDDEFAAELGWSIVDVHQFVEVVAHGPMAVMTVDVGEDDITAAAGERSGDLWVLGEENTLDVDIDSPARPYGKPVRMAWRAGTLAVSSETPPVQSWASADTPTLMDDPGIAAIARVLDDIGAYAAYIAGPSDFLQQYVRANPRATDERIARAMKEPIPGAFDRVGVGLSVVDGAAMATFVYHHDSAAAAAANAPVLDEVFREGISIKGARAFGELWGAPTIVVDGEVVIVSVAPMRADAIASLVFNGDTVVATR